MWNNCSKWGNTGNGELEAEDLKVHSLCLIVLMFNKLIFLFAVVGMLLAFVYPNNS
jgi:hypothetical protein